MIVYSYIAATRIFVKKNQSDNTAEDNIRNGALQATDGLPVVFEFDDNECYLP